MSAMVFIWLEMRTYRSDSDRTRYELDDKNADKYVLMNSSNISEESAAAFMHVDSKTICDN